MGRFGRPPLPPLMAGAIALIRSPAFKPSLVLSSLTATNKFAFPSLAVARTRTSERAFERQVSAVAVIDPFQQLELRQQLNFHSWLFEHFQNIIGLLSSNLSLKRLILLLSFFKFIL